MIKKNAYLLGVHHFILSEEPKKEKKNEQGQR